MSRLIASSAIQASHEMFTRTRDLLESTIAARGERFEFEFPDTAFCLPLINAMTAYGIRTPGQMREGLRFAEELLTDAPEWMSESWEERYGGKLQFVPEPEDTPARSLAPIDAKREALKLTKYESGRFGIERKLLGMADRRRLDSAGAPAQDTNPDGRTLR